VLLEMKAGTYTRARSLRETLVKLRRSTLGECHPQTLVTTSTLATVLMMSDVEAALPMQRDLSDVGMRVFGGDHARTLFSKWMTSSMLHTQTYRDEGLSLCEEVLRCARTCCPRKTHAFCD
jgi:hypothetical protein